MKKYSIYVQKKTGEIIQIIGNREELGLTPKQIEKKQGFINIDGVKLKWNFTGEFKAPGRDRAKMFQRESEEPLTALDVTYEDILGKSIYVPWKSIGIKRKFLSLMIDKVLLKHFIEFLKDKTLDEVGFELESGHWDVFYGCRYTNSKNIYPHPNAGLHSSNNNECTRVVAENSWAEICSFLMDFCGKVPNGDYNKLLLWCKRHSYQVLDMEFKVKGHKTNYKMIPGLMSRLDLDVNPRFIHYPGLDLELYTPSTKDYLNAYLRVFEENSVEDIFNNIPVYTRRYSKEHLEALERGSEIVTNVMIARIENGKI